MRANLVLLSLLAILLLLLVCHWHQRQNQNHLGDEPIESRPWYAGLRASTSTSTSADLDRFMANREQVMLRRKARLEAVCKKYIDSGRMNKAEHIEEIPWIYMPERNFSYCMLSKTGSTTMAHQLRSMVNGDRVVNVAPGMQANMKASFPMSNDAEIRDEQLRHVRTFVFVRHPFVRLVGSYIAKKQSVLRHALRYARQHPANQSQDGGGVDQSQSTPFSVFVAFLLRLGTPQALDDVHFSQYWFRCDLCHAHLDWIGQSETSLEDKRFIFARLGLPCADEGVDQSGCVLSGRLNRHGSDATARVLFGQLTRKQIYQLYRLLRIDFDLFGYDYRPFMRYGRKSGQRRNKLN